MTNNKLQDYYRAQRRFEYEKNVPIKNLNMTRKWHKIVISLLKMDLAVVGQKTKILSYKANVTKPTIFACTHIGRYDIEQALLSIGAPAYVFFGDPGNIYRTINGLLLKMNGVIYVDTDNKADRVASKDSGKKLLKQGGNLLIFPEGAWNITENEPCMRLFSGAVEMALETGADIVPVAMERYGSTYVINVGENISYSKNDISEKICLTEILRDILCALRWEIWENQGLIKRKELSFGAAQEYINTIMRETANGYTIEKIMRRRYQENHTQYKT